MKKIITFLVVTLCVFSCKLESGKEQEIASINIDIEVERFDKLFAEGSAEDLPKLKKEYPFMFSKKYDEYVDNEDTNYDD